MKRLALLCLLLTGAPTLLVGQQTRLSTLKSALRNLVVAQENFFADHGTYTTDVSALGLYRRGGPRDSIWVQVVNAGGRSWNGRAIHQGAKLKSCVIYVGYKTDLASAPVTDADSTQAKNEGEPTCDRM
jgi:hypothetical protein